LDPAWKGASNELIYVNSLKMKLSVLFGVTQMLLGISLKFSNCFFFRNWIDLFCEAIPQLVFLVSMFGYMDFLIMYKWVNDTEAKPSIINTMIEMALGSPAKHTMWESQESWQNFFMTLIMCAVPIMLIPKPILLNRARNLRKRTNLDGHIPLTQHDENLLAEESDGMYDPKHGAEEHSFGDDCVHQGIETIEFVLGTVSHTASYLRTWALSLAHNQLALVFLQKTVLSAMVAPAPLNAISIVINFGILATVTFFILIVMDLLECFLHTLRLHWVEFQSKFFHADGYLFVPYRHKDLIKAEDEN